MTRLEAAGVVGKLWIDGSFTTQKHDPDDIDVVLWTDGEGYDAAGEEAVEAVEWFNDSDRYTTHRCHGFHLVQWPDSHQHYDTYLYQFAYWLRQWGYSMADPATGQVYMKGVACYDLRPDSPDPAMKELARFAPPAIIPAPGPPERSAD